MKRRNLVLLGATAAMAALAWQAAFILPEGRQALVVRLGRPVAQLNEPGLRFKAPLIDSLVIYDSRLLSFDSPPDQIILGDQKRIEVDSFTRYRIVDPLRFYQSVRTVELARTQLSQIVGASFRRAMGQIALHVLLTPERDKMIEDVRREVTERARPLGIEVVQVHIRRADLPMETSQAIYERMRSEREREAKELRAQGSEQAQLIRSRAEKERTVLLSDAEKNSRIMRGEAEAEANETQARAFATDSRFFHFYRSLQSYRKPIAEAAPTIILSPDAELLTTLKTGPKLDDEAKPAPH
jgi:membrane protease subunit HflC